MGGAKSVRRESRLLTFLPFAAALLALSCSAAGRAEPAAWSITGQHGNRVVLLGSVHYLRDSDYPLPERIEALYEAADELVMEIDLDDVDPLAIQTKLLAAARLPPGSELPDVLDARVYSLAERKARELGIDLSMLDGFEPWLVAITMLDVGMERLGYRPDRGLEQHLLGRARADDKPISGLEGVDAQVAVFGALGQQEEEALLEQTIEEIDTASDTMDPMIAAWRDGELEPLADSLMTEFDDFPELYEALVIARNTAWIERIENLLAEDVNYLVVVGALHLVGEDSVIELLRSRGLTVTLLE